MIVQDFITVEDLIADESFLNYYFQKNEDDVLDWEDWQADSFERETLVKNAFLVIDRLSLKFDDNQVNEKLRDLQVRLQTPKYSALDKQLHKPYRKLLKIAATIALILAASMFFLNKSDNIVKKIFFQNQSFGLWHPKSTDGEGGIALTTQAVENNSIAKVSMYELSDGSVVRLNTGSSIRLSDDFGKKNRDIFLEGEAYFEVAKDATKPFRVHAGQSITTAIGTTFTIRALKDEANVKVLLVEGKVEVKSTDKNSRSIELAQGQQIEIHHQILSTVENIADIVTATRWKDGYLLTFRENKFSDVIKALSDNYRTPISGFEHTPLADAKITAEFDKYTPLSSVMEALAFANGFDFLIRKDSVIITKIKIEPQ